MRSPSTPAGRVISLGLLFIVGVLVFAPWSSAGAHTALLQGSPGPTQRVGGTVEFLDLVFVDEVSDAVITLEGPDGELIDGSTVVSDGQILRYEMPALVEEGRYIVRYDMISADGDETQSGYIFNYEASALEPVRLGDADLPNNNATIVIVVVSIVLALGVVGLAVFFLSRLERGRVEKTSTSV